MALATTAAAENRTFNVPAGDLQGALDSYAQQAGVQLLYRVDLVSGVSTTGAQGLLSSDDALAMVLADTGLEIRRHATGAVAIVQAGEGGRAPQSGSAAGDGAGTVEALIVTAQKREEDIQDVPIAISAFSQEDLTRSQIAGGPDLMTQVPNMTFTKTNFTSYSIQIRGIGTQAISATTDPAVAVAFNNTPFIANRFFEQEFYDLQRIEVLRGPQGTLYGRNATAGVVNIISAKPKFNFEAKLSGDIANYSSHRLEGMINIPLVEDKVAVRLAGAWTKRDGFVTNILTGEQTDERNLWSGRASFAIEPNDRFRADLIYEHFEENDGRLRSGKQLCHRDPGPLTIGDTPVLQEAFPLVANAAYFSQSCLPASLYSPDSFQAPNGFALPYWGPLTGADVDPYASTVQSRDLRAIETHITPEYEASADLVELQLRFDLTDSLTLASETAFALDRTFSFQDFNRFNTTPGVFDPGGAAGVIDDQGFFCDPQIGCTNRLAAADLAQAQSQHFSQEFRLSSNFDGPFNFSLGGNFLRYETEINYYVFINSLSQAALSFTPNESLGDGDNACVNGPNANGGYRWSNPDLAYRLFSCQYIDYNNIHNLDKQGRNYFLSKNPYNLISYAAFGEAYYNLAEDLKVTVGLRWTVDSKSAPQHPSWLLVGESYGTPVRKIIEQEWREPTGRLAIDWKPALSFTDETLVYASYVRGYKAGGANPPPPVIALPPIGVSPDEVEARINQSITHPETFDAEYVNAYEVGTKNTLLEGVLILNLNAFYYDYKAYQISQIVNRSAVNLNFDVDIWGAELEADWRPMENLRLGLKIGYQNTRVGDDQETIDLMDRVAGHEGWILMKPFPPQSSNCIIPNWLAELVVGSFNTGMCVGYVSGMDPMTNLPYVANPTQYRTVNDEILPITSATVIGGVPLLGYPGFNPASAPNNGEGFTKDLSGNELPNAPDYTATITADWTLPLPNAWLMTLHTDLYYQSEAWTRIFNTEGYDKLKAYSNINFAAIFTNEDAGWTVMAYVKNVLDRDSITGAFLNSDDTGLTTNVFLTEPRLYGIRVTRNWSGDSPLGGLIDTASDGPYPFRVELEGLHGPFNQDHEVLAPPTTELFSADFPYPFGVQEDLDWGNASGARFTWQPVGSGWSVSGSVRYGRALGDAEGHKQREVSGSYALAYLPQEPQYYYDPGEDFRLFDYATTTGKNEEIHTVIDFTVGRDVGLGALSEGGRSVLSAGLRYAAFKSKSQVEMHGQPDVTFPETDLFKYGGELHRFAAEMQADRQFKGAGVTAAWDASINLLGDRMDGGQVAVEFGLGGSVLWGRQKTSAEGEVKGWHITGIESSPIFGGPGRTLESSYVDPIAPEPRSTRVTVPSVDARLGLSYEVGAVKVSGGYRFERFFDAIDGGLEERQTYDRDFHGPYFKLSVGFGG